MDQISKALSLSLTEDKADKGHVIADQEFFPYASFKQNPRTMAFTFIMKNDIVIYIF